MTHAITAVAMRSMINLPENEIRDALAECDIDAVNGVIAVLHSRPDLSLTFTETRMPLYGKVLASSQCVVEDPIRGRFSYTIREMPGGGYHACCQNGIAMETVYEGDSLRHAEIFCWMHNVAMHLGPDVHPVRFRDETGHAPILFFTRTSSALSDEAYGHKLMRTIHDFVLVDQNRDPIGRFPCAEMAETFATMRMAARREREGVDGSQMALL